MSMEADIRAQARIEKPKKRPDRKTQIDADLKAKTIIPCDPRARVCRTRWKKNK